MNVRRRGLAHTRQRPFTFLVKSSMDTFYTIEEPVEAQLTEKRSRFLAFAVPVQNEEEAKATVAAFKKKYYDARHVCYAYVIGSRSETTRSNDDGEPSGTAGRPILGQLQARGLTNTVAVVVRYFGGVKLGTGPLGVAYRTAISDALDLATVREEIIKGSFRIDVPYTVADTAMRHIRDAQGTVVSREYTANGTVMQVEVRLDDEERLRGLLAQIYNITFLDEDEDN